MPIGGNVVNTRTCTDTNSNNFLNTENVHGILHILADKGRHFPLCRVDLATRSQFSKINL